MLHALSRSTDRELIAAGNRCVGNAKNTTCWRLLDLAGRQTVWKLLLDDAPRSRDVREPNGHDARPCRDQLSKSVQLPTCGALPRARDAWRRCDDGLPQDASGTLSVSDSG